MLMPRRATAGSALLAAGVLLLSGCDISSASTDDAAASHAAETTTAGTTSSDESAPQFGSQYEFDSGLTITVSRPTSFQPGTSAHPRTDYGIAFRLTIHNETDHRYSIADMSLTAVANGLKAPPLTDRTQGYTGLPDSADRLGRDEKKRVTVAFALRDEPQHLELTIEPDTDDPAEVTYVGSARKASSAAR